MLFAWIGSGIANGGDAPALLPGLVAEFESRGVIDHVLQSRLELYVAANEAATPFLPKAPFTSKWTGFISSDLRSDYFFQAESSGSFTLEINGKEVLKSEGDRPSVTVEKPVRLNKGTNSIQLVFRGPSQGDAWFRLQSAEKVFLLQPIAPAQLSHLPDPSIKNALDRSEGRGLFAEFRCIRCHTQDFTAQKTVELDLDAPSLEGIGSRRQRAWLQRWIENPKELRPTSHMPKVFSGEGAAEKAKAVAAYLASLEAKPEPPLPIPAPWKSLTPPPAEGPPLEPKPLFERLHCGACHLTPGNPEEDPEKLSLDNVAFKFRGDSLETFLRKPEAHYRWIRMPNFRLTPEEAHELANYLITRSAKPAPGETVEKADPVLLDQGKQLVQTSGCLNCHPGLGLSVLKAPALLSLNSANTNRGCLAEEASPNSKSPQYSFTSAQKVSLRAFQATDHQSLEQHRAADFAERQSQALRCAQCHGVFEGFPAFEVLGGKLKPEWAADFIRGSIPYKPRGLRHPKGELWLEARMPAFPAYADAIAAGLAELHGYPPKTLDPSTPISPASAQLGQKLVGKAGGFSCISCHGVGSMAALEVFESEGINLAYTARRVRKEYFQRWMRLPLAVDPSTKMPAYFDEEGKSPLVEFLDGDAEKQIDAIWEYIRGGEKMALPSTGETPP